MEEGVYICSWSRSADGFELWLKSRAHIRASGATYDAAEAALISAIQDSGGAMLAVLEFDPPLPPADSIRRYLSPAIVRIWGDERCEQGGPPRSGSFANAQERDAHIAWDHAHYVGGLCRECKMPVGLRSDKPLELDYVGSGQAGGFVPIGASSRYVFAEKFLALLDRRERDSLELRRVIRPRLSRMAFYELIGPAGPPLVSLKGSAPHSGCVCDVCGGRTFGYLRTGFELDDLVAREDLPNPLPGIFTVGTLPNVELVATAERWAELVGEKGAAGIVSVRLGVVPPGEVDRDPALPKLSERRLEAQARRDAHRQR